MPLAKIDTPCIGICSTVYGDEICIGCKRTYREVINWNEFTDEEKLTIYKRLEQQIVAALSGKIEILNTALLRKQLDKFNIRYREEQNPLCWAFYLLREGHDEIKDLKKYGIQIPDKDNEKCLSSFYKQLDAAILK